MNEFGVPGGNGRIAPNTNRQTARLSGCGRPWLTGDNKIIDWALRARLERHLHNALLVTKAGDRITREERCQEGGPVQTFESDTAANSGGRVLVQSTSRSSSATPPTASASASGHR